MAKKSRKSLVDLSKYGHRNSVAVFNLLDHKDLGISRSYFNKLKHRIKRDEGLPSTITNKILKIKNVKDKFPLELRDGTKPKIVVPVKQIKYHQIKTKEYVWVKLKLGSIGRIYYQSFTMPVSELKKDLSKRINTYLSLFVKKYDNYSVFVYEIQLQNV